jgi:hypothetical protein
MSSVPPPLTSLLMAVSGWVHRHQLLVLYEGDPLAALSPHLNAYGERFVRSLKEECRRR